MSFTKGIFLLYKTNNERTVQVC